MDRVVTISSDSSVASDTSADPFAGIVAAKALAKLDFARAVANTVMAGDNAIAMFADLGLAMIDLSDPTAPVQGPIVPTDGKVISVEYDEELGLAYAADITGKLYVFSARSADGFAKLSEASVPGLANQVLGMARLGSILHVLAGETVIPVSFDVSGATPTVSNVGAALALTSAASHIAAGGGALYLASKSAVQAWSVPATGAAALLGQFALAAEPRALLAKGSKVLVGLAGVGLATVDFGNPAAPAQLALDRSLSDLVMARLFGRTLAVGLARNLTATIDLTDFAAPRVLTVDPGAIPQFMAVLNGVLLRGTTTSAQVVNIPPSVSISIPSLTASSFPLHGQIPVTFSKPIDPASVRTVTLICAGTPIEGQVIVALEGTSLRFIPAAALPAGVSCTLNLASIKDASGLGVVGSSSLVVTTAAAASKAITNNGSKFAHVADGVFTDANEWSDVIPAKGMYTYFYGDFVDGKLNILNDWFFNADKIDSDCYNEFYVWTGGGSEEWTIRAYADRKVTVLKNGVVVDPETNGVTGGAGYGPSPNVKEPHTIYELQIAAKAGAWGVKLHDPGPTYSCKRLAAEPSHIQGTLGVVGAGSGVTIDSTQKPVAPAAVTLLSPGNETSVGTLTPTLTWSAGSKEALSMLAYQVQISKVSTFASLLWNAGTMSSSYTVPAGVLGSEKTYHWRIVASNNVGQATSTASSFFTGKRALPDAGFDAPAKEAGSKDGGDAGIPDTGYDVMRKGDTSSLEVGPQRGLTIEFANSSGDAAGLGQGTVMTEPVGIECINGSGTCSAFFSVGSKVVLTATPATGWFFLGWGGDCAGLKDATSSLQMAAGSEPMSCTVRFDTRAGTAGTGGSTAGSSGTDAAAGTGGMDAAAGTAGTAGTMADANGEVSSGDAGIPVFTGEPSALAGDSSYVYIGQQQNRGIYRLSLSGSGTATLLVPGVSVPANGLAVGAQYVYWIDGETIMRASKNGVDAGVGGEALVSGETGLRLLGSNHRAESEYNKTAPTHLFWVSGSLSSATIKTLSIAGGDAVTIASEVGMTANDRVVADSGNIFWVGTWHGSDRVVYRSELGYAGPIQVGTDTGMTGLARFATDSLAYLLCSSTDCTLKLTSRTGVSQGAMEGFPATMIHVAGYRNSAFAYSSDEIQRFDISNPGRSSYLSDQIAGDVYPSAGGFFYIDGSGNLQNVPMP